MSPWSSPGLVRGLLPEGAEEMLTKWVAEAINVITTLCNFHGTITQCSSRVCKGLAPSQNPGPSVLFFPLSLSAG